MGMCISVLISHVEQENKLFMMKIPSKLWKSVQKYENYDYVNK